MAPRYHTSLSQSGATYVLPADDDERERLNLQHSLFKELFDHELLPTSLVLQTDDKILDAGTGSGAWVLDVAKTVPAGVTVYGFDIEGRLLPPDPPINAHFSVHSALSLPAAWASSFSLVHQRMLIASLDLSSWQRALANYLQVLKPGGYLLLYEPLHGLARMSKAAEDSTRTSYTERFDEILKPLFASRDLLFDCGERLPLLLKEAGFMEIRQDVRICQCGCDDVPGDWRRNGLGAYRGMKLPVLKSGGFGIVHSDDEWEALMTSIEHEWEQSSVVGDLVRIIARKPM